MGALVVVEQGVAKYKETGRPMCGGGGRERERERNEGERMRDREREHVCVCEREMREIDK